MYGKKMGTKPDANMEMLKKALMKRKMEKMA
jgi:hypothetical protein